MMRKHLLFTNLRKLSYRFWLRSSHFSSLCVFGISTQMKWFDRETSFLNGRTCALCFLDLRGSSCLVSQFFGLEGLLLSRSFAL